MAIPKKYPTQPTDFPSKEKHPERSEAVDPEEPLTVVETDPDYIPDEEQDSEASYEVPTPGEGP